jgi:hypothetical protein
VLFNRFLPPSSQDHFMIFCEACNVWFHGKCVGVEDGDVHEDALWVCCQKCKYDLPRNLRGEALIGNSFKKQQEAGTACSAKLVQHARTQGASSVAADDSDDDIPILQRPAALTAKAVVASSAPPPEQQAAPPPAAAANDESDDDEPVVEQQGSVVMMKILEPLATFVGTTRMPKRDALTAVLSHISANNLFDAQDEDYVLTDAKLKPLVGNRTRVKLRKLAKRVAKYIVADHGKDDAKELKTRTDLANDPSPSSKQDKVGTSAHCEHPPPPPSGQSPGPSKTQALAVAQEVVAQEIVPTPAVGQTYVLSCLHDLPVPESPLTTQDNLKKRLGFGDVNSPSLSREATVRTAHIDAEKRFDDATVALLRTVRNQQERQGEITPASGSEKGRKSTGIGHLFSEAGREARETVCGSEGAPSSTKKRRLIVSADGQEDDEQAEPNQAGNDVAHAAHSSSPKRKADELEAEALDCEEKSPSKKMCTRDSNTGAATQVPDSDTTSVKSSDSPSSIVLAECSVHPSAVVSTAPEVRPKFPAIAAPVANDEEDDDYYLV